MWFWRLRLQFWVRYWLLVVAFLNLFSLCCHITLFHILFCLTEWLYIYSFMFLSYSWIWYLIAIFLYLLLYLLRILLIFWLVFPYEYSISIYCLLMFRPKILAFIAYMDYICSISWNRCLAPDIFVHSCSNFLCYLSLFDFRIFFFIEFDNYVDIVYVTGWGDGVSMSIYYGVELLVGY